VAISLTVFVVKGRDGQPSGLATIIKDITERKRLEEQLRQAQKMEAIGQLTGGIAHDFNNMLTIINGYSELTLQSLKADDPLRPNLEQVKEAGERAAALTRQLLAFSRKQVLEPRVLDLNAVLTNLDRMLQRLIGEDINLVTAPASKLWRVKVDPGQIEQVIMNLAVNARDAMSQGGKLTIETANVELDDAYAREHISVQPGPYVLVAVSDTGCGMDAKTQARIFEPFFTTKEPGKGTGLGLSTVYGIVKQSGGYIWVYSEVGQGTTFKVYFPRVEAAVETVEPSREAAKTARGSETVLLVEDDAALRTLIRRILQVNGYTVLEAHHGKHAIEVCQQHEGPIHLLVTDVVMPEMSGTEAAGHLSVIRPDMKILFLSGYADEAIHRHGVLAPGAAFLPKPFTPNSLARKVREVLDAPENRG
jgi:signal transduction histidine kinase/CheY-like chemotaxis protein